MSTLDKTSFTPEEYLELERQAEYKSEYYNGQIFASLRVLAAPSGLYTYPDLSVACDEPQFADPHVDTLVNPTLIVEILSPAPKTYETVLAHAEEA